VGRRNDKTDMAIHYLTLLPNLQIAADRIEHIYIFILSQMKTVSVRVIRKILSSLVKSALCLVNLDRFPGPSSRFDFSIRGVFGFTITSKESRGKHGPHPWLNEISVAISIKNENRE
jgi:hypothetical protein